MAANGGLMKPAQDGVFTRTLYQMRVAATRSYVKLGQDGIITCLAHSLGHGLAALARRLLTVSRPRGIWIDVGAHEGEKTFEPARRSPSLTVYAFEPNMTKAMRLMGRLPNYVVIPAAVADHDGFADYHVSEFEAASSILAMHEEGRRQWKRGDELAVKAVYPVPCLRLETFLEQLPIAQVEFLKIDAQGADLQVVKSVGERLRCVKRIEMEVQVTPFELYAGSATKDEVVAYMEQRGFALTATTRQSLDQEENLTFVNRAFRSAK
jgi:FkbM family methyltransferase